MSDELRAAIESLGVTADPKELRALLALRARLDANIAERAHLVNVTKTYEVDQAVSATGWLKAEGGQSSRAASSAVRTGTRAAQLPVTRAAWVIGELTTGQVEVITTRIPNRLVSAFAEHEPTVVPALVGLTVSETGHVINRWVALADQDGTEPKPEATSELYASEVAGKLALNGALHGVDAHLLLRGLTAAIGTYDSADSRSPAQRRAEVSLVVACGS